MHLSPKDLILLTATSSLLCCYASELAQESEVAHELATYAEDFCQTQVMDVDFFVARRPGRKGQGVDKAHGRGSVVVLEGSFCHFMPEGLFGTLLSLCSRAVWGLGK